LANCKVTALVNYKTGERANKKDEERWERRERGEE
jgi:hypothetical protein